MPDIIRWRNVCRAFSEMQDMSEVYTMDLSPAFKHAYYEFMGRRIDLALPNACRWGYNSNHLITGRMYYLSFEPDCPGDRPRLLLSWIGDRWLIRWYRSFAAKSVNRAVAALAQIPELLDPRALLEGRLPTLEDLAKRGAPITPYIVNAEEAAYVDPYV